MKSISKEHDLGSDRDW